MLWPTGDETCFIDLIELEAQYLQMEYISVSFNNLSCYVHKVSQQSVCTHQSFQETTAQLSFPGENTPCFIYRFCIVSTWLRRVVATGKSFVFQKK